MLAQKLCLLSGAADTDAHMFLPMKQLLLWAMLVAACRPSDGGAKSTPAGGASTTSQASDSARVNAMLDAAYPKGGLYYWKSNFLPKLTDQAIDAAVESFSEAPSPGDGIIFEHFHGALTRVPVTATPVPHRSECFNFVTISGWQNRADTERCTAWARRTYERVKPSMASGRWLNYLDHDEAGDPAAEAYGPNYQRLREIKRKYDPENIFHLNQNIKPL